MTLPHGAVDWSVVCNCGIFLFFFIYQQASGGAESIQEMVTQDVTFTFVNGKLTGSNGVANTTVDAQGNPLLHIYTRGNPKLPVSICLEIEFEKSLELAFPCITTTQLHVLG